MFGRYVGCLLCSSCLAVHWHGRSHQRNPRPGSLALLLYSLALASSCAAGSQPEPPSRGGLSCASLPRSHSPASSRPDVARLRRCHVAARRCRRRADAGPARSHVSRLGWSPAVPALPSRPSRPAGRSGMGYDTKVSLSFSLPPPLSLSLSLPPPPPPVRLHSLYVCRRCFDEDAVQLRRRARDMETQMLEMNASRKGTGMCRSWGRRPIALLCSGQAAMIQAG